MSKTLKLGGIMLVSIVSLQVVRIVASLLPLSDNVAEWLFNFVMQVCCLGILPFVLYKVFISGKTADFNKDIRFTARIAPSSFLLAIVIGFCGYVMNMGASAISYVILDLTGYTFIRGSGTIYSGTEVLVFEIIGTAIFPAIFEEITNRGVLMAALDGEKNDAVKIIFMGVFFGAFHQNVAQFMPTMLIGFVVAYMAVKSQSILPGMIVHFMNNFFITITSYNDQTGGVIGSIMNGVGDFLYSNVLVLSAAVVLAVWLLIVCLRSFAKINAKYRDEREKFSDVTANEPVKRTINDIYSIYGVPMYDSDEDRAAANRAYYGEPASPRVKSKEKISLKDHAFLIIAFVAAMAVTVITYVWGVLR